MIPHCRSLLFALLAAVAPAAVGACVPRDAATPDSALADSSEASLTAVAEAAAVDTARIRPVTRSGRTPPLRPLADSIARQLVFHAQGLTWLTVAAREGRLLLDLGRVDTKVATPERLAAYREAVTALAPIPAKSRLRLYAPTGVSDALVRGYDTWNGRIVATLDVSPELDSLAKQKPPLLLSAQRADTASPPVTTVCARDSADSLFTARIRAVRDSIATHLRADTVRLPERLQRSRRVQRSHVVGCFGEARAVVIVTLLAGDYEHVREAAVLLDSAGAVTPIRVSDVRFRAHEPLFAFDADGDAIDDVAVKGRGPRLGEWAILRFNREQKRLERLTGGFSWEVF